MIGDKRRLEVLELLKDHEKSQVELMKLTKMYKAHTSRTLSELTKKKLIICINPQDRAYKFYKVTSLGKKVLAEIERIISFQN